MYYTVLYYTVLYCTVLYCTVLYCTVRGAVRLVSCFCSVNQSSKKDQFVSGSDHPTIWKIFHVKSRLLSPVAVVRASLTKRNSVQHTEWSCCHGYEKNRVLTVLIIFKRFLNFASSHRPKFGFNTQYLHEVKPATLHSSKCLFVF